MSVYNLGIVNSCYLYDREDEPKDHMHCHVYDEGVAGKEINNVASPFIMKTLQGLDILKNDESRVEQNIIFDNCSRQIKNTTVLKLVPFLVEMEYVKRVNFVFLVFGHAKNTADMLFHVLKSIYCVKDSNSIEELCWHLCHSKKVTVNNAEENDFHIWDDFLSSLT